ncbi:molybdenum cofactor biosynthesis protein MoaE [Celeribacter ethanolicus]|uniref:Molybdopterin synthase catalytic subunit n=1 Tax=Celeribacter ethanolicus TaxID=1758178 RepID=A0A291GDD7_9RHOB|nr:molybdenum cofactor biosynthesis protein MoaE [Celeribacter ethanolicus]ATG48080.1 molybdenum cofactor biosynthesis protein MoaE [Celeribacter ethanolicus]TNE67647.1 MAG: molybdenum cofactor biosynthesis protein MoaE [Paracoccaceae bacterium]
MRISVQSEDFELAQVLKGFGKAPNTGATVSFTGLVRDDTGTLDHMEIEHYPGMCEAAISKIAEEAATRWSLTDCLVIHRYGQLRPGDQIMMVATAARHRVEAFEAAEYLMDYLKSRAPFWKKEVTREGADWVAAKEADEDALKRW